MVEQALLVIHCDDLALRARESRLCHPRFYTVAGLGHESTSASVLLLLPPLLLAVSQRRCGEGTAGRAGLVISWQRAGGCRKVACDTVHDDEGRVS
jgi:hypothetical protein